MTQGPNSKIAFFMENWEFYQMELNLNCCIYTVKFKIQVYEDILVEKFVIIKRKLNNRQNDLFLDNKVKVQACRNVQLAL